MIVAVRAGGGYGPPCGHSPETPVANRRAAGSQTSRYPPGVTTSLRRLAALLPLALALGLAACSASAPTPSVVMLAGATAPPMGQRDTVYDPAKPAPALQLTDQDGRPFDLTSLRGTPVFVYFGYTHCTDVCPTTLADVRAAIKQAGLPAKVVMVTVDPARDSPAWMKTYLDAYKAGFIGLTGTDAQIAATAAAWGVSYSAEPADSSGNYEMTHTTDVFLVDGAGILRNHIFFGAGSSLIAQILKTVSG
jgi:protein SCO1/2